MLDESEDKESKRRPTKEGSWAGMVKRESFYHLRHGKPEALGTQKKYAAKKELGGMIWEDFSKVLSNDGPSPLSRFAKRAS